MKELLTGKLPESFLIEGRIYKISSDFRTMMKLEDIFSSNLSDAEKGEQALRLFYGCIPYDVEEAVEKLCYFWECGRKGPVRKRYRQGAGEAYGSRPIYSLSHDAGLIYAAFLGQYGVDLHDVKHLHWWKFKAMFEALDDHTLMKEVMRCRAVEVKSDMPKAQKDYYNAMKKRYALPLPDGIEKHLSDLEAALMGDGNISEVMECRTEK